MAKRTVTQCANTSCKNKFIQAGRGRRRIFCSNACKQVSQRLKAQIKDRTNLDLTQEEMSLFEIVIDLFPTVGPQLDRIERLCGEESLIEAIRLINIFAPTSRREA